MGCSADATKSTAGGGVKRRAVEKRMWKKDVLAEPCALTLDEFAVSRVPDSLTTGAVSSIDDVSLLLSVVRVGVGGAHVLLLLHRHLGGGQFLQPYFES